MPRFKTVQSFLNWFEDYTKYKNIYIKVFSNGSGEIGEAENILFKFDNPQNLHDIINHMVEIYPPKKEKND